MKKFIGTTFAMLFIAASGIGTETLTAQAPASPSNDACVIIENDYARTRLGSLCLFRDNWVCRDTRTPIPGCNPAAPSTVDSLAE